MVLTRKPLLKLSSVPKIGTGSLTSQRLILSSGLGTAAQGLGYNVDSSTGGVSSGRKGATPPLRRWNSSSTSSSLPGLK